MLQYMTRERDGYVVCCYQCGRVDSVRRQYPSLMDAYSRDKVLWSLLPGWRLYPLSDLFICDEEG